MAPGAVVERQRDEIVEHVFVADVPANPKPRFEPIEERAVDLLLPGGAFCQVGRIGGRPSPVSRTIALRSTTADTRADSQS